MGAAVSAAVATLVLALGATLVAARRTRMSRRVALSDYLATVDGPSVGLLDGDDVGSFADRVLRPAASSVARRIGALTPRGHLDAIHARLLKGGLATKVRAEEVVALEVGATFAGLGVAVAFVLLREPPGRIAVTTLVLFPVIGLLAVQSWLSRSVQERQDEIRRDLPDVLDLLSLSVQAGLGLEQAMALVIDRLPSALGAELALTLREMELGRSRREAFTNLKRRTDVLELNAFVSAIVQADALGVPIGRVLSSQAAEMRLRRRQWARERAAKLPVKILFPLLLFVFPPMFVVILGPAIGPLRDALM